jgi:hypothetical protein
VPKPPALAERGGAWFRLDEIQLHLGVENAFHPARKAHPGLGWDDIEGLAAQMTAAKFPVEWDSSIKGRRRFHTADPFGNRLEFLEDPSG